MVGTVFPSACGAVTPLPISDAMHLLTLPFVQTALLLTASPLPGAAVAQDRVRERPTFLR